MEALSATEKSLAEKVEIAVKSAKVVTHSSAKLILHILCCAFILFYPNERYLYINLK